MPPVVALAEPVTLGRGGAPGGTCVELPIGKHGSDGVMTFATHQQDAVIHRRRVCRASLAAPAPHRRTTIESKNKS